MNPLNPLPQMPQNSFVDHLVSMSPEQLSQVPVDQSQQTGASASNTRYGKEFFAQSPGMRLEQLKLQQSREGGLDPVGQALFGHLQRRMQTGEQGGLTTAESTEQPVAAQPGLMDRIMAMDPLAPVKQPGYGAPPPQR